MVKTFKQFLNKPTPTIETLAKKYKKTKFRLAQELKRGIKTEKEHTDDEKVASEIALDHMGEHPDYYTKLKKIGL